MNTKKTQIIQTLRRLWKKAHRRFIFNVTWTEERTPHDDGTHGMGIFFVAKFGKVHTDLATFNTGAQWWKDAWRRRCKLLGLELDEEAVA